MSRHSLLLHEEVLLLALRNEKGTVASGVMYQQAMAGAMLAELILDCRVRVVTEGRAAYAVVDDHKPIGEPVIDDGLTRIATATRRATLKTWVQRLAGTKKFKHRVAASLVRKGVLREDEGRMLLLFTRRIYPERDPAYERRIVQRLEAAIFSDTAPVDARTTVLIALAHHTGLLKANLDRTRLKARKDRVKTIIAGDAIGKATKQAVEAVQAAILVAAIMPAATASSH
jgi:Golgi phosphoprotein 3